MNVVTDIENCLSISSKLQLDQFKLYQKAILIRSTEQALLDLFKQGKTFGTVHTCIGQEFIGIAIAENLQKGDTVFSNHRCHGHFLAKTNDVDGLIAELMGKATGVSGGRGGSQHLCKDGFYSNGIQGGIAPVSAGIALAHKLNTKKNISVVFIGDGTLGEGAVYETLNLISKWNLPVLVVVEDNKYAQSTPSSQTLAGTVKARAEAFGIKYKTVGNWNLTDLNTVTSDAVGYVREYDQPVVLHINTYRLAAHSKGDDDRDSNEVRGYIDKDLIGLFEKKYPIKYEELQAQANKLIKAAIRRSESLSFEESNIVEQPIAKLGEVSWSKYGGNGSERINTLIYQSLNNNMQSNERIIILGEDIEHPYGGAFKVTRDLSAKFPGRVRNMPISESLIVGMGNGLALQGYIPVCEIMFGDFLLLAADQIINHAAKFNYMYNDQVVSPLIIRTPMGGRRGYGPTHSQSIEKHFFGVPGIQIIALNQRVNPADVYDELFQKIDCPTIVVENKILYSKKNKACEIKGLSTYHSNHGEFTDVKVAFNNAAPELTIYCYGGMLSEAEKAINILFEEEEITAEIICPTLIYPLDITSLCDSLCKSKTLLVLEEGQGFSGFGSEVISQVMEADPTLLSGGVKRIYAKEYAIPASGPLEEQALPQFTDIVNAAIGMIV